jgi:hypothetical protein
MNETTVTKGERYYTVALPNGVIRQAETLQGAADWLWAMRINARWMICPNETNEWEEMSTVQKDYYIGIIPRKGEYEGNNERKTND